MIELIMFVSFVFGGSCKTPVRPPAPARDAQLVAATCCAEIHACESGPLDRRAGCVAAVGASECAPIVASLSRDVDDCFLLKQLGHVRLGP